MIPEFDMHPIEFRLLRLEFNGIYFSPAAIHSQYLKLRASWISLRN